MKDHGLSNQYNPVIGLEIHAELSTRSKMFCQCLADYFGQPPNTHVCPVCLGLPGALPVPNRKAVEWTILLGKALNCKINKITKFDRKHYFYPDLPKGYQISQYDEPIATGGIFQLGKKTFRIRRVHLEEDTGKLIHKGDETLVDFNRSGVPLVEIVTEPDFTNSTDVKAFLEELQTLIRYLEVSDCDMEKGSMRLEPNVSLRKLKSTKMPAYKVEVKNINSFRFAQKAVEYEIKRQTALLQKGETPTQETRGFNETKGITFSQRSKEEEQDYRYFPEPDIPPFVFETKFLEKVEVPELPHEKVERYVSTWKLRREEALLLTRDKKVAQYFERVISKLNQKKPDMVKPVEQTIAKLIVNKKIPIDIAESEFIERALEKRKKHEVDEKILAGVLGKIVEENKKAVEDYRGGKEGAVMFLVGQAMRELKGKADAVVIREKLMKLVRRDQ
ncbi:Asp-tRNA(Asn)/Glu-tRNA(Gln) amidotransferase subunit GatB [Candidatus Roizmanbacteria bacterium]|nr:Asp-tRNA(Asn)/Glu-tRNA(Gln) amidotransferase subunit GatB [Candidatus Roizmanbacteria bacterium]